MRTLLTMGAVLLCALHAGRAGAQDIGRLFSTPEERIALERQRAGLAPLKAGAASSATIRGAAPPQPGERVVAEGERVLVVNGVVRRSGSGRETTWVNSVPYSDGARVGGVGLERGPGTGVALTLPSGRQVSVKAGQRVEARSGRVSETYQPLPARAAPPRIELPADVPE